MGQLRLPAGTSILRSIPNVYKNLLSGVTTMRIMGQEHYIDVDLKKAIHEKRIQGPRLLVSGIGLVASNGHGVALTVTDGREEVLKRARMNLAMGADFLKIFVTGGVSSPGRALDFCGYTPEEVGTAVEEARRAGTYVAAHAHGGAGVDLCIEQGVRTIEHGAFVTEAQLDQMIKKEMWLVGTFSILFHPEGIEKTDFQIPSIREKVLRAREAVAENFGKIIKSGVNLAVGTDSMHGWISYDLECLVNFGASNRQAILWATRDAARACRIEDRIGTLEKGKMADFIALSKNPLEDIKHLRQVEAVYKEGEKARLL
jgi:imidazolonepropionase-like amidohydrolase